MSFCSTGIFLSTPSARRATLLYTRPRHLLRISIHALREEGDAAGWTLESAKADFYPRPPRGGRRSGEAALDFDGEFLSTPSARRATAGLGGHSEVSLNFYPRPPRGGRPPASASTRGRINFYPRPPRGGRPKNLGSFDEYLTFLSTPSARRATARIILPRP